MRFCFTDHSKYRILERNIKISEIKDTIRKSNHKNISFENKIVARKSFGGKMLEFVYIEESENKILIITAYYL